MRKIISILVALGLILAFSAVATPTAAAVPTCAANLTISNPCAGGTGVTYCVNFTSIVTLLAGNDRISLEFGAGTTFKTPWKAGDITVALNGGPATNVNNATIVAAAPKVDFLTPVNIVPGDIVTVCLVGKVNNAPAGEHTLYVDYKLVCCDPVVFDCVKYKIKPATSTYGLVIDFGKTYPGIAKDFVPPFKACGQNDDDTPDQGFDTVPFAGGFYNQFDLIVAELVTGCAAPCANATLAFDVSGIPTGAKVNLVIASETFTLNSTTHNGTLAANVTLAAGANTTLYSLLHFDTPGKDYKICFKLVCPWDGVPVCPDCLEGEDTIVAERCFDFDVYQWKDATKIILKEKWNLISLPLVPLVDPPVAQTLASIAAADLANIVSIWHYDRCTEKWFVYPTPSAGQETLTELVDGDAYWVRVKYPLAGCGNIVWWVWGTVKPMPPAAPAEYDVCEGWNMVGYLGLVADDAEKYLWNWVGTPDPDPVVYGWTQNCWFLQTWDLVSPLTDDLVPGQGYWMAFPMNGAVYVP